MLRGVAGWALALVVGCRHGCTAYDAPGDPWGRYAPGRPGTGVRRRTRDGLRLVRAARRRPVVRPRRARTPLRGQHDEGRRPPGRPARPRGRHARPRPAGTGDRPLRVA